MPKVTQADTKMLAKKQDIAPITAIREEEEKELVNHPAHYGGDTIYETIKVIEAWELNFNLGNTVKYISRVGKKGERLEQLRKAQFYLNREIETEVAKGRN